MNTSKTKKSMQVGIGGIVIICIIILCTTMFAIERIDSGQTGIIVNLAGSERGVDDAKVDDVLTDILDLQNEFLSRINHPQPGNVKGYFRKLYVDFGDGVEAIIKKMQAM